MTCFDYDDLRERLIFAGYSENSNIFRSIQRLAVVLDNEELNDDERDIVLSLFSSTALTQLNTIPKDVLRQTKWQSFDYGNVKKGDYVRVRFDAYDSDTGVKHNGRVGVLIDMYAKRCKVQYIGMSKVEMQPHPVTSLESLQKV